MTRPYRVPLSERFWLHVTKSEGCWEWQGGRSHKGYGQLKDFCSRKVIRAHRVAWELTNGPIPEGMCVLHKCDNPPCCNPEHLFLGTTIDNVQDMVNKGRQSNKDSDGTPKITFELAQEMRGLKRELGYGSKRLSVMFNISTTQVERILQGHHWKP